MGAGRRQPKVPGPKIPDDGGKQQREHHEQPSCLSDADEQVDREQVHNAEGNRHASKQDSEKVHEAGPNHGFPRLQRSCVDHRRDGIRGVVKAVNKLKSESNGKTKKK
jgi:hypothetical protein